MGALGRGIGTDAVNADDGENETEQAHRRSQLRAEAVKEEAVDALERLIHGLQFADRKVGGELADLRLHWRARDSGAAEVRTKRVRRGK